MCTDWSTRNQTQLNVQCTRRQADPNHPQKQPSTPANISVPGTAVVHQNFCRCHPKISYEYFRTIIFQHRGMEGNERDEKHRHSCAARSTTVSRPSSKLVSTTGCIQLSYLLELLSCCVRCCLASYPHVHHTNKSLLFHGIYHRIYPTSRN